MDSLDVPTKPSWLRTKASSPERSAEMRRTLANCDSRTVCDSSRCPNLGDCWGKGHATFMILGERCTRACRFCAVPSGEPSPPDPGEPVWVAESVRRMGLRHAVITSVTRDDLEDGGAGVFAEVIRQVRGMNPGTSVEVLIPDLQGDREALNAVVAARPEVLGHNLEVVRSLQWVRDPMASYQRSLDVLAGAKEMEPGMLTKSSLMLGLGESEREVREAMKDLLAVGTDLLTLGQYLPPRGSPLPLRRYVPPGEFEELRLKALDMGFKGVKAGPLVRSSFDALSLMLEAGANRC